ncbi:MAG: hypothetical protein HDR11_11615 [Lachnospiraceae bacterium]|nr:hypothetical protein [Lachnospiraceae bacterium]
MDIKEKIEGIVEKVTKDKSLMDKFQKNPTKTVEELVGVDLPDDVVEKVVEGVKGKISVDKLSGVAESIKKLF